MGRTNIYLDYNATAPVRPEARAAALAAMDIGANASSVHGPGRRARALIERAREDVAALVGAEPDRVVFTSGGTEANALALAGSARAGLIQSLVCFGLEHESVLLTSADVAARNGLDHYRVPSLRDGVINLDALEGALREAEKPALVSVMAANNETGVVQPLGRVRAMCSEAGALLHVDAVQIAGRLPFDASAFDFVTLSAHKLGGLQGAGALILGRGIEVEPLWGGGAQERRRRPGTEAVAAIAAFGAAARAAAGETARAEEHAAWRDQMEDRLAERLADVFRFGADAPRLPQTSCLGILGMRAESQIVALDLEGFAVSAGAACSSGKTSPSHVLYAMGADEVETRSAIRVSFGWATREEEIENFVEAWVAVTERAQKARRERLAAEARNG